MMRMSRSAVRAQIGFHQSSRATKIGDKHLNQPEYDGGLAILKIFGKLHVELETGNKEFITS
jgi:hypothetical protein